MKIVVIGAVAAGTSAAAKARRNNENAEIVIYEKDSYISYSGCGMPYYISNEVSSIESLVPRNPAFFKKKYNIDIKTGYKVLNIDTKNQTVEVKANDSDTTFIDHYDKLVIATGATANKPPIKGVDKSHVFFLRNIKDAIKIKKFIEQHQPKHAVIAGTGFIGFEILDNLVQLDINVNIVEIANKITPNLDEDMALYLENELAKKEIKVLKSCALEEIEEQQVTLSDGSKLDAQLVILSTGVRPNTMLAKNAQIECGESGAIKVNNQMQTNIENIYACGDCIETYSSITNKPVYRPMGSTANKTGRIAGDVLSGGNLSYKGNLGTGIFKLFDLTIASTGLNESEALKEGYDIVVCHNIKPNKPEYLGGKEMIIKGVADKASGRLLGVQIIGTEGVDKRIDVFATLITYKAKVEELFHLDLAYAPPFSTTKDPVHYTGMILDNAMHHQRELITSAQLENLEEEVQIIDARSAADFEKKGSVDKAINIPQAKLREDELLDKNKVTVTFCNKGVTGNAAQNILINKGFKKVYNLSGGHRFYKATKKK